MKKYFMGCIVALLITGCGSSKNEFKKIIIGEWDWTSNKMSFFEDGTFEEMDWGCHNAGTYSVDSNGVIQIKINQSDCREEATFEEEKTWGFAKDKTGFCGNSSGICVAPSVRKSDSPSYYDKDGNKIDKPIRYEKGAVKANVGEKVVVSDFMEITINKVSFNTTGNPDESYSCNYSSCQGVEKGNIFIIFDMTIKNLNSEDLFDIDINDGFTKIVYDNKYKYDYFFAYEFKNNDYESTFVLAPLTTTKMYFTKEVSEEIATSSKPLTFEFNYNETDYVINLR